MNKKLAQERVKKVAEDRQSIEALEKQYSESQDEEEKKKVRKDFIDLLMDLAKEDNFRGPKDLSINLDRYLYGDDR